MSTYYGTIPGYIDNTDAAGYLASLVRQDIRKRAKSLAQFKARPGQAEQEAQALRAKWEAAQEFRYSVLAMLKEKSGT